MRLQKNYIFIGAGLFLILVGYIYFSYKQKEFARITSFKDCIDAGYKVLPTYPEECRIPGKRFINPSQKSLPVKKDVATTTLESDPGNKKYLIEGQMVTLVGGKGQLVSPKISTKASTTLLLTNIRTDIDINGDDIKDSVFLLKNSSGSTQQSYYYLTATVSLYNGFIGVNGLYVEENIKSALIKYENQRIAVEYTTLSSQEKKYKYYIFEDDILKEHTKTP